MQRYDFDFLVIGLRRIDQVNISIIIMSLCSIPYFTASTKLRENLPRDRNKKVHQFILYLQRNFTRVSVQV